MSIMPQKSKNCSKTLQKEKIADSYKPTQELTELQCDNCGHKHINISLSEYISSKDEVEVTK